MIFYVFQISSWSKELQRMGMGFASELTDSTGSAIAPPPKRILIHFDLKGAPPKVSYINRIMFLAKSLGATGVLMEYEDMAPFSGRLSNIAAGNAYTKDQIKVSSTFQKHIGFYLLYLLELKNHIEFDIFM